MDQDKLARFLKIISQIESSGGKNFNHPMMESGIHQGHSAIGQYGLMPNTVNEVINRMQYNKTATPEILQLRDLDPTSLKKTIEQNSELENQIAQSLAQRVLDRQKGNEEKAAYSWNQGHNLKPEAIDSRPYMEHDYVKKFQNIKNALNDN